MVSFSLFSGSRCIADGCGRLADAEVYSQVLRELAALLAEQLGSVDWNNRGRSVLSSRRVLTNFRPSLTQREALLFSQGRNGAFFPPHASTETAARRAPLPNERSTVPIRPRPELEAEWFFSANFGSSSCNPTNTRR